jgi:hypothetical protein
MSARRLADGNASPYDHWSIARPSASRKADGDSEQFTPYKRVLRQPVSGFQSVKERMLYGSSTLTLPCCM